MNRLLTPDEIAELLGVKKSTIYQWTHQGFIPHVKLGRSLRFREAAIEKWVEKRSEAGRVLRKVDIGGIELMSNRSTTNR
jgi:excisionase family DNA binding protein